MASTQDYSLRAGVVRADEVGRLSSRVNDLLHRVELWHAELNERLRREQEAGAQYQQLAQHDHLTGLPNRMAFELELESRLVKAQAQQRQLALFFIDLDGFKTINDQLGHAAGDQALKSAAERMLQVLRSEDRLFRLGGDEFALLVSAQGEDMPAQLASRLVSAVSQPFEVNGRRAPLGASIGLCFYPNDASDPADLLRLADAAMYQAKAAGKNGWQRAKPLADDA